MTVHITLLEAERFKRISAVVIEPTPTGLTIVGGANGQGKTSVLDAIVYALGGERYKPSDAINRDSDRPPHIKVKLSNGLVISRDGKNGALKVVDKDGMKGGQGVLDKLISKLALDMPKFMESSSMDKAKVLLKLIGAGDALSDLDEKEKGFYEHRRSASVDLDRAIALASTVKLDPDAPSDLVSVQDILNEIKSANELSKKFDKAKARNDSARSKLEEAKSRLDAQLDLIKETRTRIETLEAELVVLEGDLSRIEVPSTDSLNSRLVESEEINESVRRNVEYHILQDQVIKARTVHMGLDESVKRVRSDRVSLLDGIRMPLDGLSIDDGELIYNGSHWDCMSGADQLMVATSIVKAANPDCSFVLIDKLEQMDGETLKNFSEWASKNSLQIIATRVSTGDECSVIIEDGSIKDVSS